MFRRLPHNWQVLVLALVTAMPAVSATVYLLWRPTPPPWLRWTLLLLVSMAWIGFALMVRARVVRPLRTLSGLLAALRQGDFSIQARGARAGDPLGEVILELNGLVDLLRQQRLGALEATALLRTVMEEIDLAVFAFDDTQRLRLANRAGERLLAQPVERLTGRTAAELGLAECLEGEPVRTLQAAFAGGLGRWNIRRSTFRQGGRPHQLLVLADLSQALREEERLAWQRLLRVLGHELNNSLAPIKSIADSLARLLEQDPLPEDWREDSRRGMEVLSGRAEALSRFMESYSRLARLPHPRKGPVDLGTTIRRVAGLETRLAVSVRPGPDLVVQADSDQIEQLLINLVCNAADAALETKGAVTLRWAKAGAQVEVCIEDEGPGLSNTANLFVPFFTTKPGGSGIGLVISRQIAEAHGGSLQIENRKDRQGCIARLRLPLG
ncbi:MAG TPA: ATP-binding protein [Verrucomicrobiota bacterium]|nr:ATP-binding protein [Verrucomicrobiota bacterium]HRZ37178.1 ATP-binding protein [Candidatus Paceibacterota bacterium]HRZ58429.1 ATP-binding protein [Candidatus Paceibacterota bacterium]